MKGDDGIRMSLWTVQIRSDAFRVSELTFDVPEDYGRRSLGLAVRNGLCIGPGYILQKH